MTTGTSITVDEPLHKTRSLGILHFIAATRAAQRFKNDIEDPQMDCPKCNAPMEEATYGRNMTIDRCTGCEGIWFDLGEAEQLKDKWMSEFLDTGNAKTGKANNNITDCPCPRCGKTMEHIKDADQPHIGYEACAEHGMYFDAGEFTDFKHETLFEKMTAFLHR